MQNIKITAASEAQLREFATNALQLDVTNAILRADLLAAIAPVWTLDEISVPDDAEEAGAAVAPVAMQTFDTHRDDGPPTMFKIGQTDMPGGKHPAAPDVNGKKLVIQRNILVTAPYAFYLALNDAKVAIPHQAQGVPGMPVPDVTFTEVTNYPLLEVVLPPAAEIDAWHARNGSRLLGGVAQKIAA